MTASIIYAGYGCYNGTYNVTQHVSDLYNTGTRNFYANNTLYGDPAPGETKYLYIVWNSGGIVYSGITGEDDDTPVTLP